MLDFSLFSDSFLLVLKIMILISIAVFGIFMVVFYTHVRSLTKIVYIASFRGSQLVGTIVLLYTLSILFLFFLALVIL